MTRGQSARQSRPSLRSASTIAAFALVYLGVPALASAGEADKAACADAYKSAQTQRKSGSLKAARESLLVCVSDRCPAVVQPDCMRWLTEVEAAQPSLTFAAKGSDGKDVVDVRVFLDDNLLTDALDGKSLTIDPGSHRLKFERAGETPIEQVVVVREGEKNRLVAVSWAKDLPRSGSEGSGGAANTGTPPAVWILGAVGVAGLATFGTFAAIGMSRRSNLKDQCFGNCAQSDVDSIKTDFLIADIGLGVGVVGLGVATALFFSNRSSGGEKTASSHVLDTKKVASGPTFSWSVAPKRDGAVAGVVGSF